MCACRLRAFFKRRGLMKHNAKLVWFSCFALWSLETSYIKYVFNICSDHRHTSISCVSQLADCSTHSPCLCAREQENGNRHDTALLWPHSLLCLHCWAAPVDP